MVSKDIKGITVSKYEDFSEWFTQVIQKAELIEYSPVSGCYILRPSSYHIWEKVQSFFDQLIKADGVKNAYFPLFIPESLLVKEEKHVEGFAPEVAWVERGGNTELGERLAVRPTSETIMYDAYSKWIRSYKDLPLRLNQWCNVVRWEFKHCTPFLRSREFLWQEGHTVFATKEEAQAETYKILDFYEKVFNELYAMPVLKGIKSEQEKFAGADYTLSVEAVMPNGKAIQGATSHHLGQNFSKAFDIKFKDNDQQDCYGWQNSWGLTTRSIGMAVMTHSDDKGLVLPPKVALHQVVIVPILFDNSKEAVLKEAKALQDKLARKGVTVHLDDREGYSPGWKFNQWELQGVPLRVELGPRDVENKQAMIARRDNGEKQSFPLAGLPEKIPVLLEQMQQEMFAKAEKFLKNSITEDPEDPKKEINDGKIILVSWCTTAKCEEDFKIKTMAKSLNAPLKQPAIKGRKCFSCGNDARKWFYFGKSY